ncbi:MAG: hypothetical protein AAB019_03845 [Planctomycetota bacterium]
MPKPKKPYAKPVLKGLKALEVGAATCCKATTSTCSKGNQQSRVKGQRTVTLS